MEASIASHHPHPHLRRRLHPWPHQSFPAFSSRTVLLKVNRSCPKITATAAIEYDSANFPPFLPPEVKQLRDPFARALASRIQRLPVQRELLVHEELSGRHQRYHYHSPQLRVVDDSVRELFCPTTTIAKNPVLTGCIKPNVDSDVLSPVLLLHGFDSSCLEWRNTYPKLEKDEIECWAMDILGWGFSYSANAKSFGVAAKREHIYQFWRTYIKKPMVLVGASLGGAAAIDFTLSHPEAVSKLVLVNAQGYAEGTGKMATFPRFLAYAGVSVLKNIILRTYAHFLVYHNVSWDSIIDEIKVGRLHCFMPGWSEASVEFMLSGGYNVASRVSEIEKETLVIWGEQDKILSKDTPKRFKKDLVNGKVVFLKNCGHLPHIEKPEAVAALISDFCRE